MLDIKNTSELHQAILNEKNYLASLYISEKGAIAKKDIVNSSDDQLNLLWFILHYICKGDIHVLWKSVTRTQKGHNYIKVIFCQKKKISNLECSSWLEKTKKLCKFSNFSQTYFFYFSMKNNTKKFTWIQKSLKLKYLCLMLNTQSMSDKKNIKYSIDFWVCKIKFESCKLKFKGLTFWQYCFQMIIFCLFLSKLD